MAEGDRGRSSMKPGARFGRFEILGELGSGGMGSVYRARDTRLGRVVALKVLHAENDKARADVLREARAAAKIDHPNAVSVFDADEVEGVPYIEMELIEGETLRAFIGRGDIALETKVGWLIDIARALGAAHEKGVIHRDLKPENVMVREDGIIKVLDFGIASMVVEVDRQAETGTLEVQPSTIAAAGTTAYKTSLRGTPAYCSPEQLRGEPLDTRTDQFSWGVLAYELIAGEHPFAANELLGLVDNLVARPPKLLKLEGAVAFANVSQAVFRALAKTSAQRFPSMDSVVDAIFVDAPANPSRHSTVVRTPAYARAAAVLLICVSLMIILGASRMHPPVSEPHPRAKLGSPLESPQRRAARAKYELGLLQMNEGSPTDATDSFLAACHDDPAFAPAQVQVLANMADDALGARDQLSAIRPLYDSLTEEERALVYAMEPLAESPPNLVAVEERLSARVERVTSSPLLGFALAQTKFARGHLLEAIQEYDRVLESFPGFGAAAAYRAVAYLYTDDVEPGRRAAEDCIARFPASTFCLSELAAFYIASGDCAAAAGIERRLVAISPNSEFWHLILANTLFNDGLGIDLTKDALDEEVRVSDAESREDNRYRNRASLAILIGDFEAAREANASREQAVRYNHNAWAHSGPLITSLNIAYETGQLAVMSTVANGFLGRLPAWFDSVPSVSIYALRGLYWSHAIARSEYVRKRDEWAARDVEMQARAGTSFGLSWLLAYVQPIHERADAEDALRARPRYTRIPNEVNRGNHNEAMVGEMYRLLGDSKAAVRSLRRGAASCEAISFPFEYGWANLHLGQALEASANPEEACSAYAKVLAIWGKAKPRSLSANVARERRQSLRCPPSLL